MSRPSSFAHSRTHLAFRHLVHPRHLDSLSGGDEIRISRREDGGGDTSTAARSAETGRRRRDTMGAERDERSVHFMDIFFGRNGTSNDRHERLAGLCAVYGTWGESGGPGTALRDAMYREEKSEGRLGRTRAFTFLADDGASCNKKIKTYFVVLVR